jgi:GDP-L-fucose synthase
MKNYFYGKECLVTGGTGMIGRCVVDILLSAGAKVTVVSLDNISIPNVDTFVADLADFSLCKSVTRDMDCVFHVAGVKGNVEVTKSQPASFLVPLLQMNTNLLEACRLNRVKKVVFTSSIGAYPSAEVFTEDMGMYGEPMDLFPGWAKRMAEKQIEAYKIQYGLEYSVVRPCNVFGTFDNFDPDNAMVIPSLMARIHSGENPLKVWGDGSAIRDFLYAEDCAEGIVQALYYGTEGFVNLGSGIGTSIKELVETLHEFIDFDYEFDTTKSSGFPKRVMDISKAKRVIHYNPTTTLREGLEKTWNWYLKHDKDYLNRHNYFKV